MASQRRMIYSSLYANAELNMLPLEIRYLYIGTIVLADDMGKMRADSRYIRGQIFSFDEKITSEMVENWLCILNDLGQISVYEVGGVKVLKHPKWHIYQRIRKDLKTKSKLPEPLRDRNGDVTGTLLNISKDKRSKEKVIEANQSIEFLSQLPTQDLQELSQKYKISPRGIQSKATDLKLYCESKAKTYKNYRAFLENAIRKDQLKLRNDYPLPKQTAAPPEEKTRPLTPEEKQNLDKTKQAIINKFKVKSL
jgi:hypothetical protein